MEKMGCDFKTDLAILGFCFFLLDPDTKKLLRMGGNFLLFQKPPQTLFEDGLSSSYSIFLLHFQFLSESRQRSGKLIQFSR